MDVHETQQTPEQALPSGRRRRGAALRPAGAVAAEHAAELEVTVRGLRSADGTVAIALFDQTQNRFDARTDPIRKAYLTIADGEARWIVEDLPPGDYALLAYHDENGNGELDFRPLGIPKEPIAVSNGAKRLLGPAALRRARSSPSAPKPRASRSSCN